MLAASRIINNHRTTIYRPYPRIFIHVVMFVIMRVIIYEKEYEKIREEFLWFFQFTIFHMSELEWQRVVQTCNLNQFLQLLEVMKVSNLLNNIIVQWKRRGMLNKWNQKSIEWKTFSVYSMKELSETFYNSMKPFVFNFHCLIVICWSIRYLILIAS